MEPMGDDMAKTVRPFAVFDIDGTLIRWQLYHAVADSLVKLGYLSPEKFQAIKDARMIWKRREDSDAFRQYELELVKQYANILASITAEQFDTAAAAVFHEHRDQVYIYTRDLIKNLKKQSYHIFAISGSQTEIVSKIADYYGFDDYVSRVDERSGQGFSGKSVTPIFNKDSALQELVSKHGATFDGSIGVGDSQSDIKMLELTEQPIAFNPERALFDHARAKGWKIVIERKNMVYELEAGDGSTYVLV